MTAYYRSPFVPIDLPYTLVSLRQLLASVAAEESPYSHEQVQEWAGRFWWYAYMRPFDLGLDVDPAVEAAADIAQDIEMQWDMYVGDSYSPDELKSLDLSQIRLPSEWFADWLANVDRVMAES